MNFKCYGQCLSTANLFCASLFLRDDTAYMKITPFLTPVKVVLPAPYTTHPLWLFKTYHIMRSSTVQSVWFLRRAPSLNLYKMVPAMRLLVQHLQHWDCLTLGIADVFGLGLPHGGPQSSGWNATSLPDTSNDANLAASNEAQYQLDLKLSSIVVERFKSIFCFFC